MRALPLPLPMLPLPISMASVDDIFIIIRAVLPTTYFHH